MYHPLDLSKKQIRLLHIQPGPDESPVVINIILGYLQPTWQSGYSNDPQMDHADPRRVQIPIVQYEALSYEWGDPDGHKYDIWVDKQPFEIRENLFMALRHMRRTGVLGPLWVDAICINQGDNREKGHQVRMMSLIYRRAMRVRVWLGEMPQEFAKVCRLVETLVHGGKTRDEVESLTDISDRHLLRRYAEDLSAEEYLDSSWRELFLAQARSFIDKKDQVHDTMATQQDWRALYSLLSLPYWSRIWIIQEYVLARDITLCCNDCDNLSGQDLELALRRIKRDDKWKHKLDFPRPVGARIVLMRKPRREWQPRRLLGILEDTMDSKCQDPRDRIYGIIGLAEDLLQAEDAISVDYDKNLSSVKLDVLSAVRRVGYTQENISRLCEVLDRTFAGLVNPDIVHSLSSAYWVCPCLQVQRKDRDVGLRALRLTVALSRGYNDYSPGLLWPSSLDMLYKFMDRPDIVRF